MKNPLKILALAASVALFSIPAHSTVFTADLLGSNEAPLPNASAAIGFISAELTGDTLSVDISFSGLEGGPATAAHIHCCVAAGVAGPVAIGMPGFPAATSGVYTHDFDLLDATIYGGTFFTNSGGTAALAEAALIAALFDGFTYFNIHNATYPGGEIRGQLAAAAVPEPDALALFTLVLVGLSFIRRKRLLERQA